MIEIACPNCGRRYKLGDALAGRRARCKDCLSVVAIPALPPAPAPQTEPNPAPRPPYAPPPSPTRAATFDHPADPSADEQEGPDPEWANLLTSMQSQEATAVAVQTAPPKAEPKPVPAPAPPSPQVAAPAATTPWILRLLFFV